MKPITPIEAIYVTSGRFSGSRNMAKFRAVTEIMGDYARLYLDNGKSYENDH